MQSLLKKITLALYLAGYVCSGFAADTLPTGGVLVSGNAEITAPSSNSVVVNQITDRAIVNWQSFSVGTGNSVTFNQPASSSAILNRVTGDASSSIAGLVSANGQVFLINPNGIAITATGTVNVGEGFVASTLDISNNDFNARKLNFTGNDTVADVANAGNIHAAQGGFVALLGSRVANSGNISVALGRVAMGAGERATLDLSGDGFLQVAIPSSAASVNGKPLVDVSGQVVVSGGRVEIKTATALSAIRDVVNITGNISTHSVSKDGGVIVLDGGAGGNVHVLQGALLDARSDAAKGGSISATGHALSLDGATLNANGATGGGTILLGGDYQGGGSLSHASTTIVGGGSIITANATQQGDGGKVVLWSDESTNFSGNISARGAGVGNGGLAEISSHGLLDISGWVDLNASSGLTGTLLLDPRNVFISTGVDTNHNASFTATGNNSNIKVSTLQAALAGANVTISTGPGGGQAGDITVSSAVTWASGYDLTLVAAGSITQDATVSATNGGTLTYSAGSDIHINQNITGSGSALNVVLNAGMSGVGAINIANATINTNNGNLIATASQTGSTNAIYLNNMTLNIGNGIGVLTGFVSGGVGRGIQTEFGNVFTVSGGALTLNGTATDNAGLQLRNSNTFNNISGSITLNGTSTSYRGIDAINTPALIFNGSTNFYGTTTSGSAGSRFENGSFTVNSGNVSVYGNGGDATGIRFAAPTNSVTNNGIGTLSFVGESTTNFGLSFASGSITTLSGDISMHGTSNSNDGIEFLSTAVLAQTSGNLNMVGNSTSGTGFNMSSGSSISNTGSGSFSVVSSKDISLAGSVSASVGGVSILTTGDFTIASTGTVSGSAPILSATGAFINNRGSDAVTATSGRWLIYSSAPGADTFGNLNSSQYAIWNNTYTSLAPGSVTATGNRYIFSYQPTLTLSSTDATKTYGTNVSSELASHYAISGLNAGVSNAYLADTVANAYGGVPVVTSAGATSAATVAGGPYVIHVEAGTLSSNAGYTFIYSDTGKLMVSPKAPNAEGNTPTSLFDGTLSIAAAGFNTSGLLEVDGLLGSGLLSNREASVIPEKSKRPIMYKLR
ncbi:MAG: beta strand repeat-containing protein [Methylophilaceae bacterium]